MQDILGHIHCLMPMREAARAACVSRAFLRSWRGRPNLIFNEDMIGLKPSACRVNFCREIDTILRNHSGIGVKIFKLDCSYIWEVDDISRYLDIWLQVAVKPGIEELTLMVRSTKTHQYNFPCSLLSDGIRNSIRYLKLRCCGLHPAPELGPLRSLTSLCLRIVSINGDELECLLSNSLALEQLELIFCSDTIRLKISCALQQLTSLRVCLCSKLTAIETKAPNLSSFLFRGNTNFSLGETLQMKKMDVDCPNAVHYARTELPSIMPNLETLVIGSPTEVYYLNLRCCSLAINTQYTSHLVYNESETWHIHCAGAQYANAAYQIPLPQEWRPFSRHMTISPWFLSLMRLLPWRLWC